MKANDSAAASAPQPAYVAGPRLTAPEASGPCMDAELADLDGDGDLDVVLAMEVDDNVIMLNDGAASFTPLPLNAPRTSGYPGADSEVAHLKSELALMQRKHDRLVQKEKRLQVRVDLRRLLSRQ